MASPVEVGLTVDDLERFDDDERHKYELIGGELFVSPKGAPRHQWVATLIAHELVDYAATRGGAAFVEPDVYYTQKDFVIPDVVFLLPETAARISEAHIDVPPDLLVEVSSPSTRRLDLVFKRDLYARRGVPEYWFVDLDADRIELHRLTAGGYGPPHVLGRGAILTSPHLPGLAITVDDVLRDFR